MLFAGWDTPRSLLRSELVQREYEGFIVPDELKSRIRALERGEDDGNMDVIQPLFDELANLPVDPDFGFIQPNDLESIRNARPDGPRGLASPTDDQLLDRFHGAWIGRACGCALGKPVEGLGMRGTQGMSGRKAIQAYLQNRNDWPLNNYFSGQDAGWH